MASLRFVGNDIRSNYVCADFDSVIAELEPHRVFALDTETNVVDSILARKLKVISIAVNMGSLVAVFEWEWLTPAQKATLLELIRTKHNIIQNVSFDYQVFKKHNVILENVYDTMLSEQTLTLGYSADKHSYGLQAIYKKRFDLDISKAEQLSFESSPYTDEQIRYAAIDVLKLEETKLQQVQEMRNDDKLMSRTFSGSNKGMRKTLWLENEFVKVIGDMEFEGIRIDKQAWYDIENQVRPIWIQEKEALNSLVVRDFKQLLLANEWISDSDRIVVKLWSSAKNKTLLLDSLFPGMEGTTKVKIKEYLRDQDPEFPDELRKSLNGKKWEAHDYPFASESKFWLLKALALRNTKNASEVDAMLDEYVLKTHRDFMVEQEWIVPAGELTLNWGSPAQRLKLFQAIDPDIESTGKDILEDYIGAHDIVPHYLQWNAVDYQLKNFGKRFFDEHVEIDGKFRTRYRQILATGRMASSKPNILNIPRKNDYYRKAVIPDDGWKFINADYDGQELYVTAVLSGEPVWLEAISKGYDLHSRNADMIYGAAWLQAALPDCAYFSGASYKKCKCPKHQVMRDNSKALSFGLIYGISAFSLAFRLKISSDEAEMLVQNFFTRLPRIKKMMDKFGKFALTHGRIVEPVLGRSRHYDKWKLAVPEEHGGIVRASYNYPIQSSGSALLKLALVLLRRWIIHNNMQDKIKILMPYHDEISIQALPDYAELGKTQLEGKMKLSARICGYKDLNASAAIGDSWYGAH